jgi:4-hydroxybenzoate polyprenyltransferase
MGLVAARGLTWQVALRLGRVSNVPTVWSNVLVGVAVAGAPASLAAIAALATGVSLLYIAGMFLNDAFDHALDARERPERPIPAGLISARDVYVAGGALMVLGYGVVLWAGSFGATGTLSCAGLSGAALVGSIVLYDAWHKGNAFGPWIMALCRVLVYVTAALAISPQPTTRLAIASLLLFAYLAGLTYVAKRERRKSFGNAGPIVLLALPTVYGLYVALAQVTAFVLLAVAIFVGWLVYALSFLIVRERFAPGRGVTALIAGISLLDALIVAANGRFDLAIFAVAAWALTCYLQRFVAGT